MQVPHGVRVAARSGPKLCAVLGNQGREVLVGESVGEVLSHEIEEIGVPTLLSEAEGHGEARRYGQSGFIPRGVGDPQHAETFSVRNLGGPRRPLGEEL